MIIDEDEYVDYDVGAVFPEGLFYKPDQGLVIFGQDEGEGVERTQLVINPNVLQGTVRRVNLFDADKGELNPNLYDQMALPDGMSFDRQTGLVLSGISKEGNPSKELVIDPNSISSERLNLLNVETNKIDASISTLPTGLTYSRGTGLEIEGTTEDNSLVINPKGLPTKTSLFESSSEETSISKINSHLYESDSRLPAWVGFQEENHTITIEGFPQKTPEDDEPTGLAPVLFINGGSIKQNIYLIATDTGFLKSELPDGMFFDRVSGLKLTNTNGGTITIPVGDSSYTGDTELIKFTDKVPDPYTSLHNSEEVYVASNIPTYIGTASSTDEVYVGIYGVLFRDNDINSKYYTSIGGGTIQLFGKTGTQQKDILLIDRSGLDPNGIKEGINADKITTGTIHQPIEIKNPSGSQRMIIRHNSIRCQNYVTTSQTEGYYDTFSLINTFDDVTNNFHVNWTFYDWDSTIGSTGATVEKFVLALNSEDIDNPEEKTFLSTNGFNLTGATDGFYMSEKNGLKFTGTKSVFQVYPSGNIVSSVNNLDRYVHIFDGTIEIVKNNLLYFCGGGGTNGGTTRIYGGGYLMDTWGEKRPSVTTPMICNTNADRTPSNPE